jgi:hypothetical protein
VTIVLVAVCRRHIRVTFYLLRCRVTRDTPEVPTILSLKYLDYALIKIRYFIFHYPLFIKYSKARAAV